MKKLLVVLGTRPEAIKLAPLIKVLKEQPDLSTIVCVTSQHREMLDQVLPLFDVSPDHDLHVMEPDQSLSDLTARALTRLTKVVELECPDLIIVQGDTTTAMAGALAGYYSRIPVAHVEAGLRTGDRYNPFPEEINRVFIDYLAELCFAPTEKTRLNLLHHGIEPQRIFVTGNTAIDALLDVTGRLNNMASPVELTDRFLEPIPTTVKDILQNTSVTRRMILVTGHRRENFGDDLENICLALLAIVRRNPDVEIVYPVHLNPNVWDPVHAILKGADRVHLLEPLSFLPFVWLMQHAYLILTDSGGIQEEAPSLGIPVLVTRKTTERSEGIEVGTARLVGVDRNSIVAETETLLLDRVRYRRMANATNPYGDGKSAQRIAAIVMNWLNNDG